jgi:hypothetical protein
MINISRQAMNYSPESYRNLPLIEEFIINNVKGEARRQEIRRVIMEEGIDGIDFNQAKFKLTDDELTTWGKLHPANMGGEYLPDLERHEYEIARIVQDTTTQDVISIRAKYSINGTAEQIIYRICDEYESEFKWSDKVPRVTKKPMAMKDLILMINSAYRVSDECCDIRTGGLVFADREYHCEKGISIKECAQHSQVTSQYYPDLSMWYKSEASEWMQSKKDKQT